MSPLSDQKQDSNQIDSSSKKESVIQEEEKVAEED